MAIIFSSKISSNFFVLIWLAFPGTVIHTNVKQIWTNKRTQQHTVNAYGYNENGCEHKHSQQPGFYKQVCSTY